MTRGPLWPGSGEVFAEDLRKVWEGRQEGVVGDDDLEVTAGGTGLSVDVAAGAAFVQGDSEDDQGVYRLYDDAPVNSEAFTNGGLDPADPDDPRIDRIVARVYDDEVDSSGLELWQYEVVMGTATAGATLSNLTGAAAVPDTALLLANVLVPAGATAIVADDIADRRIFTTTGVAVRRTVEVTTGSLADAASEDVDFVMATGYRLLAIETDIAARVELYATEDDRTADAARAIGTDPTGDHGVVLDFVTTVGDLAWRLSPIVDGADMAAVPVGEVKGAVTNLSGSTDTVTATLTYVPTEG